MTEPAVLPASTSVMIRHNFETAHRLPHLGGKCQSLHGHSWWIEISVTGDASEDGIVLEFGAFKARIREWIDTYLDHGAMLGERDELAAALTAAGSKVFLFGADKPSSGLDWPTVENVAALLWRVTEEYIRSEGWPGVAVTRVRVDETHVNAAEVRL
ncbi:6-carboxytetrahydropterin synthase [Dactylosporangium sp. NPDC050688]|uniref:6-pyruvoyl trahydropterin synthase family protein n=1 Tax=Dactylosporangium sp. NPDC050688 TaxID=3157217 RepID=UPI0033D25B9A